MKITKVPTLSSLNKMAEAGQINTATIADIRTAIAVDREKNKKKEQALKLLESQVKLIESVIAGVLANSIDNENIYNHDDSGIVHNNHNDDGLDMVITEIVENTKVM